MDKKSMLKKYNKKPFSFKEAISDGFTRATVRKWLKQGVIERISHGIYRENIDQIEQEDLYREAISIVGKPSAICLISALDYYQLTDIIPKQVWVMVAANKKSTNPSLRLFRTRKLFWSTGIIEKNGYSITTIEKTLVDALIYRKTIGSSIAMEAVRTALRDKKTTLSKIIKTAKDLKSYQLLRPIIEAFA